MPNSSGAGIFAKHPTITGLYLGVTDNTSPSGAVPAAFCIFRGLAVTDVLDTTANVYHHGCIAIVVDDTSGNNSVYQNTGTLAAPSWTLFDTGTGFSLPTTATDATTTTGTSFGLTTSAITTGVAEKITAAALTSGIGYDFVGSGSAMLTGGAGFNASLGAAIAGAGLLISTTGVYTDTAGLIGITANSATTGVIEVMSATGLTTGIIYKAVAAAATLTTGFYFAANDGALNVLTFGSNGHITSNQTTAPTIAVTTQDGITAAAITAGSSDVCGTITTTGTSTGGTVLTITFNKTYTVAPKFVVLQPANTTAAAPNTQPFVSSITATTFVITIPASGTYGATPSYRYAVIA